MSCLWSSYSSYKVNKAKMSTSLLSHSFCYQHKLIPANINILHNSLRATKAHVKQKLHSIVSTANLVTHRVNKEAYKLWCVFFTFLMHRATIPKTTLSLLWFKPTFPLTIPASWGHSKWCSQQWSQKFWLPSSTGMQQLSLIFTVPNRLV